MEPDKPLNTLESQFTSQNTTAEDILKSQTVGLVHLSDFRKRRVEALEQKERELQDLSLSRPGTPASGSVTPRTGASTPQPSKKKRKLGGKVKLSFGNEDEENGERSSASPVPTPRSITPSELSEKPISNHPPDESLKTRIVPNASIGAAPKAMTKSALLREAQIREQLRKDYLVIQEAVKSTEILIPFVFYDGSNIPGGICKIKKGDHIWLFLDKSRKVGAELGVGGADKSRSLWARVSVDDLMLVRGEVIIPHHYDFYYFIVNRIQGANGTLFNFSTEPPANSTVGASLSSSKDYNPLRKPAEHKVQINDQLDSSLEGFNDDPNLTKVVDRRWYQKNKHIYPASIWAEFDPSKDHLSGRKMDKDGNKFFFS